VEIGITQDITNEFHANMQMSLMSVQAHAPLYASFKNVILVYLANEDSILCTAPARTINTQAALYTPSVCQNG